MSALRQTEVDGVPTVWGSVPGPLRAALTFRVGSADETFLTAGISHLLEHLALFGLGRPGDHANGFVEQTRTVFMVEGDDIGVRDFLAALTRQLTDPPMQRLDDERGVIAAEQARRGRTPLDDHLIWRYGAASYGLAGMESIGTQRVGATDIADWSHRFATRANSVLWISGPPPAGLRLYLPDGVAQPAPDPRRSILPWSPSWFTGPDEHVTLDCLVSRGVPARALTDVLRGRLVDELRTRMAVAYSPDAAYLRLNGDTACLVATSDLVAGRQFQGVRPMLTMLERISSGPDSADAVQPVEIETWITRNRRRALDPQHEIGRLDGAAWDILHGVTPMDAEQWLQEMDEVSGEQIAAVAREARATLLAQIPPGIAPQWQSWRQALASEEPRLMGRGYRSLHRDGRAAHTVHVGAEGITMAAGPEYLSISLESTVGVLHWTDGSRVLVGTDGNQLRIEPTLWRNGTDLVAQVDAIWPADLIAQMGTRDPDAIPRPAPRAPLSHRISHGLSHLEFPGITLIVTAFIGISVLVGSALHNHELTGYYVPSLVPGALFSFILVTQIGIWRASSRK